MRIHLYTILKNEEKILPFFLRHYESFVDKIFVFDDESTDSTLDILRGCPKVEIAKTSVHGIDDRYFRTVFSSEYKKRRDECDWVMCVDSDEFIFHERMLKRLADYHQEGVKIIKCGGWSMFSKDYPSSTGQIYDELKVGLFDLWQCKPIIFTPDVDIKFDLGRHGCRNEEKTSTDCDIKMLHYRFLGKDACEARHERNMLNLSETNKREKLGRHLAPDSKYYHSMHWYLNQEKNAVELPFLNPPRR